jgi:hypothetical protein
MRFGPEDITPPTKHDLARKASEKQQRAKLMLPLSQAQRDMLKGMFQEVNRLSRAGKPGALFAQVWPDGLVVRVVNHEECDAVWQVLGEGERGPLVHSAAERMVMAATEGKAP